MNGMTRREIMALASIGAALRLPAWGQGSSQAPERSVYRTYARCLPDYLGELAREAYELRNRELAKIDSPDALRARQEWVRETFWRLTGGMPERTPLNARTTGSFERPGYRLEKVVYESQPGLHVSGNLYIPTTGGPPYPAVLFQMGHAPNGKANDGYQRCCQALARLGYLVLGFDPMGQGERTYYPGEKLSLTRLDADEEHTRPGRQMLLKGDTSTRLQTWDAVRSLDYLAAHPLADPKRLASTGQSGGGTNTMLLAAVDDRLAAAAITCPNTENVAAGHFITPGSTDDAEQNFVYSGPVGFDRWDLLYPLAGKPLLVAVSERDFFGTYSPNYIRNGLEEFRKLQRMYSLMGRADALEWYATLLPHGLAYDMRMAIYNWFERWLKPNGKRLSEEPETAPEVEEILYVSGSGSVVRSFRGKTPFALNRDRKVEAAPADLAALLRTDPAPAAAATKLGEATFRKTRIEVLEFASASKVFVPAWLFLPKQAAPKGLIVVVEPSGRSQWHEGELYDELAQRGFAVCAADLRGTGDLTPEFGDGSARHARSHNSDEHYAWSALTFGKPLAGQRVTDILTVVRNLRERPELGAGQVTLAARGMMTVPALFAAAIDPSIRNVYLSGGLVSFANLVATENYTEPFSNFVPNLLRHTDLPAIVRGMGPKTVTVCGPVDAQGKALTLAEARNAYGAAPHLTVVAERNWTADRIAAAAG